MTRLAPRCSGLAQLKVMGQVLAWRAGLAHYRHGAIAAADALPEALALAATDTAGAALSRQQVRQRLLDDPWWCAPGGEVRLPDAGLEAGQFSGFGGQFSEPPVVCACPDGFFVRSGERYFFLVADLHGAVLHGASAAEFAQAQAHHELAQPLRFDGAILVRPNGSRLALDLPAGQLAACCNGHTIALTSPFTHAVRLLPLQ